MELNSAAHESIGFVDEVGRLIARQGMVVNREISYDDFPVDLVIENTATKTTALVEAKYNATAISLSSIAHLATARDQAALDPHDWVVRAVLVVKMRRGRPTSEFRETTELARSLGVDVVLISNAEQAASRVGDLLS